ncbi:MAG: hypothetical protein LBT79_06045 [Elusimicrobiota bacterium]|jgi:hypothetical protein|nr:hypothetical protein [Elusimicrobiota bacterium]
MNKNIIFLIIFSFFCANLDAKSAPTFPNSYDAVYISARSMAMGGAATGLKKTREAFFYNPASLINIESNAFDISFFSKKDSQNTDFASDGLISATAIAKSMSFSWNNISDYSQKIEKPDGSWQKTEFVISAITIAAANKTGEEDDKSNDTKTSISIGSAISYLYARAGQSFVDTVSNNAQSDMSSGNGFAYDLSVLIPFSQSLSIGANFKNIVGFMFWNEYDTEQLPFTIRAGIGYEYRKFVFAFDWDNRFYRFSDLRGDYFHFGAEQYLNDFLAVRVGLISFTNFDKNSFRYTYGIGASIKNGELSIACESFDIDENKNYRYIISLSLFME